MGKNGGKRPGAGRKVGSKTVVAKTLAKAHILKTVEEILGVGGLQPFEKVVSDYRDEKLDPSIRLRAAIAAMEYTNSKKPTEVILQAEVHIDGIEIEVVGK